MMKYQSITILFVLLFLFRIAQSQCIETGYVKEYNGVEEKTPLPGVELQVVLLRLSVTSKDVSNFILPC